ncbi:MAG: Re/Si-specific NAD(P)(+) transhydrogenase subunit alpha [Alphaproteobacteria bacterium]|nr:Re/Si-specific NAD(P)(+) transhydrogenase subunit alpha [Alphaproteobacteria bacterium]
MKISTIKEYGSTEKRVAITPDSAKKLTNLGFQVSVQKDAGLLSNFANEEYAKFAHVSNVELEILGDSDVIVKVQPPLIDNSFAEAEFAKEGSVIIGFMNPYVNSSMIEFYANKGVSLIAMEFVPRTSKAQSFDALSSQANLAGYRAVLEAAQIYSKTMPTFMTSAGTTIAAKVLVLGTGVAGLQAIATARRLGAVVSAYDVRAAAKEQVESLGAKFLHPDILSDFSGAGGYAEVVSKDFALRQEEMLHEKIDKFDIVISTAMIPGKKAPILISRSMIEKMRPGSVIVDLAASSGGNTEVTNINKITEINKVKIIGYSNYTSGISDDASKLYASNIANLIIYLFKDKTKLDLEDEIVRSMLLSHEGKILFQK